MWQPAVPPTARARRWRGWGGSGARKPTWGLYPLGSGLGVSSCQGPRGYAHYPPQSQSPRFGSRCFVKPWTGPTACGAPGPRGRNPLGSGLGVSSWPTPDHVRRWLESRFHVGMPSVRVSVFRPNPWPGPPSGHDVRVAIPSVRVSVFREPPVLFRVEAGPLPQVAIPSVRVSVFRPVRFGL